VFGVPPNTSFLSHSLINKGYPQEAWRETHHAATETVALPGSYRRRRLLRPLGVHWGADFRLKNAIPSINANDSAAMTKMDQVSECFSTDIKTGSFLGRFGRKTEV
jgi:hypothetical protein